MQGAFGAWQNNVFTMNKKTAPADDPHCRNSKEDWGT